MTRHSARAPSLLVLGLALVLSPTAQAKKKKNAEPAMPPVGWQTEEGWTTKCYFPPNWGAMQETDRKMARAKALDEMKSQWLGGLDDGVSFSERSVDDLETTLLGRPEGIEAVAAQNLDYCKKVATGQGDTGAWESWIKGLPAKLTSGECRTPFDYTMFDYLDIFKDWNRTVPICEGNKVRITATLNDKYRVRDNGPWINAAGDPDVSTAGSEEFPCNMEGCFEGMFYARFVTEKGVETILPVGTSYVFEAPENGEISYRINDTTFYDNKWFKTGAIEDHTAIEISPAN